MTTFSHGLHILVKNTLNKQGDHLESKDQVIIDGNAVYEIDYDCKKKIGGGQQTIEIQKAKKKDAEFLILLLCYYLRK